MAIDEYQLTRTLKSLGEQASRNAQAVATLQAIVTHLPGVAALDKAAVINLAGTILGGGMADTGHARTVADQTIQMAKGISQDRR